MALIIDKAGAPLEGITRRENITLTTSIINHKWMLDCSQNRQSLRSTNCLVVLEKMIVWCQWLGRKGFILQLVGCQFKPLPCLPQSVCPWAKLYTSLACCWWSMGPFAVILWQSSLCRSAPGQQKLHCILPPAQAVDVFIFIFCQVFSHEWITCAASAIPGLPAPTLAGSTLTNT